MPSLPQSSAYLRCRHFDTATQQLVPVGPATGSAGMYVCGITPYDATPRPRQHLYRFDLLHRVWRDRGLG